MDKITIMGIGKIGMAAVKQLPDRINREKLYIDNNSKDMEELDIPVSRRIMFEYQYELSAWEPTYQVKKILRETYVQSYIEELLCNTSLLILMVGIGGSMSMAVMEFLKYYKKSNLKVPVYVVGSFPLREHTRDYQCNVCTNQLVYYLREQDTIGWTVVDTETRRGDELDDVPAFDAAVYRLNGCVEGILSFTYVDEGRKRLFEHEFTMEELITVLNKGMVYFDSYAAYLDEEIGCNKITKESQLYVPDFYTQENVFLTIEMRYDDTDVMTLNDVMSALGRFFVNKVNMLFRMVYTDDIPQGCYRITYVCQGTETRKRKIPLRELSIL